MFFEGKCKQIDRVVVSEPGRLDGGRFEHRGIGGKDWVVRGILKDFTELADKSFLDEIDDDEEFDPQEMIEHMNDICKALDEEEDCELEIEEIDIEELTSENHFGLVRGVDFVVALMDPGVKIDLNYDGTFKIFRCVYGDEPDELREYPIVSESGLIGLGVDDKADAVCHYLTQGPGAWDLGPGNVSLRDDLNSDCGRGDDVAWLQWLDDEDCGAVFEGIYAGKVRFVLITGSVVDYDVHAQETLYQYLVDALKIDVSSKVVFDELALQMIKMGLRPEEMGFDEGQVI